MSMRRGLRRESCNFCFRRKVRCDLASREKRGHNSCSQCDLRQMPCTLDSDDIRVSKRRREVNSAYSRDTGTPSRLSFAQDSRSPSTRPAYQMPPINTSRQIPSVESTIESFSFGAEWDDGDFQLNSESVAFLDTIFPQHNDLPDMPASVDSLSCEGHSENIYSIHVHEPEFDNVALGAAVEAYFDLGSLALPILFSDAFMSDYEAQACSPALVYAVACRGLSFSDDAENWPLQQKLAQLFRKNFLEAKQASGKEQKIRLDDLEALALMVNFKYDDDTDGSSESQLASLFLTHDFLVHMALHYQLDAWSSSTVPLSRASERKTLLFWHIYGIDAFWCLQNKTPSQIKEDDAGFSKDIPRHDSKGYLDTILSLAVVARQITQAFCTPLSKRKGIKAFEITQMYQSLRDWRANALPAYLQLDDNHGQARPHSAPPETISQEATHGASSLHRVVIMLLEHECYMEIDSYVAAYGIREEAFLEAATVELRVRYETLRSATRVSNLGSWIASEDYGRGIHSFTLAGLAPGIVRDICSGTCFWLAEHAKSSINPRMERISSVGSGCSQKSSPDARGVRLENFVKACTRLWDAVNSARFQHDTPAVIERLNEQLGSLKRMIGSSERN